MVGLPSTLTCPAGNRVSSSESSRRFHFIREIASGGFGSVYLTKVIHADGFSRLVAVKLLHPRWSENEEIASRMRDEARLLGWLRHKNIVDVMDLTLIDGRCAVIMEYLDAVDAKMVINHCRDNDIRVPLRPALEMCAAVASALDAAYNRPPYAGEKPLRVIHRDIKPSNIMIDDSGVAKVLDFGVARAEFDERESKTQEMAFGSLEYMPPERLFFEPESPASDVYSLGATLFELLALEKFGKAKLRPKEHEAYFEDRFDVLLDRYPMHREAEDLLHELLMSMLAFDEPDRPSAADAVARMRSFARRIPEHPLEDWAEEVVPPLLKAFREENESRSPGSLVDTILTEDAKALDQRSIWDENTGASTRALDLSALDDEMTGAIDDARWEALKQATIDDLAKRGELPRNFDSEGPPKKAEPRAPAQEAPPRPLEPIPVPGNRRPTDSSPPVSLDGDEDAESTLVERAPEIPRAVGKQEPEPEPEPAPEPEPERQPAPPVAHQVSSPEVPPSPPVVVQSAPPTRRGGLLVTLVVMFFAGSGLALMGMALIVLLVAIGLQQQASMPSDAIQATAPPPPPAPSTVEPEPEPIEGPHVRFTSARSNTEKLQASCSSGRSVGTDSAAIPGETPGSCMVTAVFGDGKRIRTRVEDAEPRKYICFTGDSEACR